MNPTINLWEKQEGVVRIASFDIAKINFAHYVEDTPIALLTKLEDRYKALPKKLQRRVKGYMNPDISDILNEIYKGGTRVQMGVYDIRADKESSKLDTATRKNLIKHLRSFEELWVTCDYFVIEQQYFSTFPRGRRRKGGGANVDAIKIGEAVFIWFLDNYPFKEILYFGSQFKTQILGAPSLKDKERKRWATAKNLEIHKLRDDQDVIDLYDLESRVYRKRMTSETKILSYTKDFDHKSVDIKRLANQIVRERQKFDDFSDACLQTQAFKFRSMVGCF